MNRISRRALIGGALTVPFAPALVRAEAPRVVVGTWGGDYGTLQQRNISDAIMTPAGFDVLQDISAPVPRRTKLIAERQNRRGSMDVAQLADFDMYAVYQQGVFEELNDGNVARFNTILPFLKTKYSIPHIYSAHTIVYNTEKIKVPPKSIHDLWDPKYKGKIGLSDFLYTTHTAFAAKAGGGEIGDLEAAKKKLVEWRNLEVKVLPSTEAVGAAFKSEEIWLTIISAARGYMWKLAGIPLGFVIPEEGAYPSVYEAAVPKNARNREGGLAYLNAMLVPEAQTAFASRMGYLPTVAGVKLDQDLDRQINFTEAERERLWKPDLARLVAEQAAMLDFWNTQFKG